ncbi:MULTISPECIES: helix-turn-helix transcriptional regulator [unclassified Adlercreutzia]|uniref:helix-turn-helix transcriptional regulator n=1 Tax=unclassified Adlercreutzia TaxID=2636013 RepID=UPI0013EAADC6|nr:MULTISPECIES: helix-turn-helix transcriptional regulator [unclassified Adlercreutzia]
MALHLPRVNVVISDARGFDSQGELSALSIGFGLHQAWIYATLFGTSALFGVPQLTPLGARSFSFASITEFFIAAIVTFIVSLLVMGVTDQRFLRFYTSKRAMRASAVLMCAATFALFIPATGGAMTALSVAAGMVSGAGSALLLLFWGTAFARCSSSSIVMNTMIAMVFAMVVYAVLLYLVPAPLSGIIAALLPLAELPILWKKTPESYILRHEVPLFEPLPVRKGRFTARFGVPVLLAGFALGSLRSISTQIILPSPDLSVNALVMVAAAIVVVVILMLTLFAGMHRYWDSLFRVMLPVVMLTLCFLPLSITDNSIAASIILVTGYLCLEALMWIFFGQLCQTFRLSAVFVFGVGRGVLALGSLVGTMTLTNPAMLDALTPFGSYGGILFYIAALVLAYMFLPRVRDIKRMIDPDFEHRHTPLDDINDEAAELDAVVRDQPRAENDPLSPQGSSPLETIADSGRLTISHDEAAAELNARMISTDDLMDEGTLAAIDAARVNGEKDRTPVVETPSKKRSGRFRTQCETIANRYLLSRRETEVLFLLAKGYNAAYIQKKLCITQSTAKTHIYHIYQKLDIHTQQELLAMVSEEDER